MKHRIAFDALSPFSSMVESIAWLLHYVKSTTLLSFYEGGVFRKGKSLSLGRVLGVILAVADIMLISEVGGTKPISALVGGVLGKVLAMPGMSVQQKHALEQKTLLVCNCHSKPLLSIFSFFHWNCRCCQENQYSLKSKIRDLIKIKNGI